MSKSKKIIIISSIAIIILILIIIMLNFKNNSNKFENIGNNKSEKEIENYILNVNSYKANITVNFKSNKNENQYKIYQEVKENEYAKQITNEPNEIKGLEITYQDGKLKIKNNKLNLSKIYQNYPYVASNNLFLTSFINLYKKTENKEIKEKNEEIIFETMTNRNKYNYKEVLHVNKTNLKPEHLEIYDMNKNIRVYILYDEIELNI